MNHILNTENTYKMIKESILLNLKCFEEVIGKTKGARMKDRISNFQRNKLENRRKLNEV